MTKTRQQADVVHDIHLACVCIYTISISFFLSFHNEHLITELFNHYTTFLVFFASLPTRFEDSLILTSTLNRMVPISDDSTG
jgi:hypothetical protein